MSRSGRGMSTVRGQLPGGVVLRVAGVGLALLFAGCDGAVDGYDPALRYPLRSDPLVVVTPPVEPTGLAPSGKSPIAMARTGPSRVASGQSSAAAL